MIKKLRRKFIFTNMLLVTLVLTAVFAALVGSNYRRLTAQSEDSLRAALRWNADGPPRFQIGKAIEVFPAQPAGVPSHTVPAEEAEQVTTEMAEIHRVALVPVFVVVLDEAGGVGEVIGGGNVEVSDEVAAQAVAAATDDGGVISGLDLRYLRETDRDGVTRVAFADRSWERSSLWPLVLSSLLVGLLALGGFFVVSLLLSGLALKPVETAWEQQRRFVADASHELKTPLTVILTNTGILLSHREDTIAGQQKWVEYIRDEAQRMRELVEDLLFLAKNDAARDRAGGPESVDLSELLWSALLPFEPVAFEHGVALESEIQEGLTVSGRSDQLRRLAAILLDNAVKYAGPEGRVAVTLAREERGGARLTVRNTGPAIPPEHLPHLFERFYRSDDSRARTSGGYGLGLAIAKSIVDGHGGSVSVSSSAEAGTAFVVRLPG